ncbi:MAG TPA: ATP-binding cassette domain-containing protein [Solirubrobacteraceae bacterium]|nr:ATP-binding cassette domain-containing protein [Solirubrobacteraceae bacterium]
MSVSEPPAVRFAEARCDYGTAVVGPVSMTISAGGVFGLVGANGAGKTTLLKLLCGLTAATSGAVEVRGERVRAGQRPASLGAIVEEPRFYPWLSARENLEAAAAGRAAWLARIDERLEQVDLLDRAEEPVSAFSQGMRQRLGLARALLGDPRLLVLDEPTNGLDPHGIRWMRSLISSFGHQGRSVIVSSHLLHEVQQVCDEVAVIASGRVLAHGSVASVTAEATSLEDLYFSLVPA